MNDDVIKELEKLHMSYKCDNPTNQTKFLNESFNIEGKRPILRDRRSFRWFLALDKLTVDHLVAYNRHGGLRHQKGMNVRVGNHIPPPGGEAVYHDLMGLVEDVERIRPYEWHQKFETLHPFTDGNGRTGRAVWAWQMVNLHDYDLSLGFLHKYYYQSLESGRIGG